MSRFSPTTEEVRERIREMPLAVVRDYGYDFQYFRKNIDLEYPLTDALGHIVGAYRPYSEKLSGHKRFRTWLPYVVGSKMEREAKDAFYNDEEIPE